MPTSTDRIATFTIYSSAGHRIVEAFDAYARDHAEQAHPEHRDLQRTAEHTEQHWRQTEREAFDLHGRHDARPLHCGALGYANDLDQRLEQADQHISDGKTHLDRVNRRPP